MTLQKVQTEIEPNLHGEGLRIGVVMARFNQQIGEGLLSGCRAELQRLNAGHVTLTTVPGALEIPLALQAMAQSGRYDALIALGAVVDRKSVV